LTSVNKPALVKNEVWRR